MQFALQPARRAVSFQRVVAVAIETLERARTSAAEWQRQNHRGAAVRAHLRLVSLSPNLNRGNSAVHSILSDTQAQARRHLPKRTAFSETTIY
jgi:hypothetical protein